MAADDFVSGRDESPVVTHRFHNLRTTAATLYWVDFEGRAVSVQAGSRWVQGRMPELGACCSSHS